MIALLEQPEPWNCADVDSVDVEKCVRNGISRNQNRVGGIQLLVYYQLVLSGIVCLMEFPEQFQNGVQFFIRVLRCMLDYVRMHKAFDRFSDFEFLDLATFPDHVIKEEYERFLYYFRKLYLYELSISVKRFFILIH